MEPDKPSVITAQDVHLDVVGDLTVTPRSWMDAAAQMSSAKRIRIAYDLGFGIAFGLLGAAGIVALALKAFRWMIGDA
jgi:hypothetical protein